MKFSTFCYFAKFGIKTIFTKGREPIMATIILTDQCNLHCKHCAVNNIVGEIYGYDQIQKDMQQLYDRGVRILFFCGGETFLWQDKGKSLRDLVIEAKAMGFLMVVVVTNGTFPILLPEADLILLSLDGDRETHNAIRGDCYDQILANIAQADSNRICLYMAINQINLAQIRAVADVAKKQPNVRAVSFNFHTPYPGTEKLALSQEEKAACCREISQLMQESYPIFNLKSAFPYLVRQNFLTPCYQCLVIEKGKEFICGRCIEEPGLCEQCGYFFAAEYALLFRGNLRVIWEALHTYLKYI